PGALLPGPEEVERVYSGKKPVSQVERLLESTEGNLNGEGTMRPAFTDQSRDWQEVTRDRTPEGLRHLTAEREGERLALLSWVRAGAPRGDYDADDHALGPELQGQEITPDFLVPATPPGTPAGAQRVRIRTLIARRCVDCHSANGRRELARLVPLDSYE